MSSNPNSGSKLPHLISFRVAQCLILLMRQNFFFFKLTTSVFKVCACSVSIYWLLSGCAIASWPVLPVAMFACGLSACSSSVHQLQTWSLQPLRAVRRALLSSYSLHFIRMSDWPVLCSWTAVGAPEANKAARAPRLSPSFTQGWVSGLNALLRAGALICTQTT